MALRTIHIGAVEDAFQWDDAVTPFYSDGSTPMGLIIPLAPTVDNAAVRKVDLTDGAVNPLADLSYVLISANAAIPNERVLSVSGGLTLVDGGAGASVTIGLPSPFTSGNVLSANGSAFVSLTPDAAGLVAKSGNQTGIAGNKIWTGDHIFQTAVDSVTGFQILDADGGTPVINVDTLNERVGFGVSAPTQQLDISNSIALVNTSSSATGVIYKGATRFIHNFTLAGTTGHNIFIGLNAGNFTMTGSVGAQGSTNIGIGSDVLLSNTVGDANVAIGYFALKFNTSGAQNFGLGYQALTNNVGGSNNVAIGSQALQSNVSGNGNMGIGRNALRANTSSDNVGVGTDVLQSQTSGGSNTGIGARALLSIITGGGNIGIGHTSLANNAAGSRSIGIGQDAARYQADGATALTATTDSIYIGYNSKGFNNSDNNTIVIGTNAVGLGANSAVIGNDSITQTLLKGSVTTQLNNTTTSVVDNTIISKHNSTGTPAANFGSAMAFLLESSTTVDQNAVRIIAETVVATHASRTYRGRLTAWDFNGEREVLRWEADGSAGRFGAFGVAAVVRPTAYTQTYSTATKTHAARTASTLTDNSAGTANTTVEALPDPADTPATADALRDDIVTNLLPALRNNFADIVAQINALKADSDNTAQFANQMCDDHQALGWLQ